jgi:hypothetical protein
MDVARSDPAMRCHAITVNAKAWAEKLKESPTKPHGSRANQFLASKDVPSRAPQMSLLPPMITIYGRQIVAYIRLSSKLKGRTAVDRSNKVAGSAYSYNSIAETYHTYRTIGTKRHASFILNPF